MTLINGNKKNQGIKIAHWNKGNAFLQNKMPEIKNIISNIHPHILGISEANLHHHHDQNLVQIEDYTLYTFDLRKLDRPVNVLMDHVGAVVDVDYSPTGKELVSGSYDKTVRLWSADQGR